MNIVNCLSQFLLFTPLSSPLGSPAIDYICSKPKEFIFCGVLLRFIDVKIREMKSIDTKTSREKREEKSIEVVIEFSLLSDSAELLER